MNKKKKLFKNISLYLNYKKNKNKILHVFVLLYNKIIYILFVEKDEYGKD